MKRENRKDPFLDKIEAVRPIAKKARLWAARNRSSKGRDFGETLEGMCAVAAAELHRMLCRAGFSPRIALRNTTRDGCHCFVLVEGLLVDVTATQFGLGEVEILPLDETKRLGHPFWKWSRLFDNVEDLARHLEKTQWPDEQIPLVPGFSPKPKPRREFV